MSSPRLSRPLYAPVGGAGEVDVEYGGVRESTPLSGDGSGRGLRRSESSGSLPGRNNLSETQNVRLTVAQSVAAAPGDANRMGQSRVLVFLQTLFQLPPAIAVTLVLPFIWSKESCEQPLFFWALVHAASMVASIACIWMRYYFPDIDLEEEEEDQGVSVQQVGRVRALAVQLERIRIPLEKFALIWVLVGQLWLQQSDECVDTSPVLYTLCFWLVVIGFTYILLPCIIIVLMLPFLCFCLPCVIRILARVFGGPDAFAGKGASKDLLQTLPVKEFSADLIPDEEDPQCSICLSSYEDGQEVRVLPCEGKHHFHKDCCDSWLTVNATCPICRYDFNKGGRSSDEQEEDAEQQEDENNGQSQAQDEARISVDVEQGRSGSFQALRTN